MFAGKNFDPNLEIDKIQTNIEYKEAKENLAQLKLERKTNETRIKVLKAGIKAEKGNFATVQRLDRSLAKREALEKRIGPGVLQKNALGLGFAAQSLAPIAGNYIGKDTKEQRGVGQTIESLGNIAGLAGAGSVAGPIGIAVGAAVGAILEIPKVIDAFTSNVPELTAAFNSATESTQEFSDKSSQYLGSLQKLTDVQSGGNQENIAKAQASYQKLLSTFTVEQQRQLTSAKSISGSQEVIAKILEKNARDLASKGLAVQIASEKDFGSKDGESIIRNAIRNSLSEENDPVKQIQTLEKFRSGASKNLPTVSVDPNEFVNKLKLESLFIALAGKPGVETTGKTRKELEAIRDDFVARYADFAAASGGISDAEKNIIDKLNIDLTSKKDQNEVVRLIQGTIIAATAEKSALEESVRLTEEKNKEIQRVIDVNRSFLPVTQQQDINSTNRTFKSDLGFDFKQFNRDNAKTFGGASDADTFNIIDQVSQATSKSVSGIADQIASLIDKQELTGDLVNLRETILKTNNFDDLQNLLNKELTPKLQLGTSEDIAKLNKTFADSRNDIKNLGKQLSYDKLKLVIQDSLKRASSAFGGIEGFLSDGESAVDALVNYIKSNSATQSFSTGNSAGFLPSGTSQAKITGNIISQLNNIVGGNFLSSNSDLIQSVRSGIEDQIQKDLGKLSNVLSPSLNSEVNKAIKEAGGPSGIAKVQSLKLARVTEKDYKDVTGQFSNSALKNLVDTKQISQETAGFLSSILKTDTNPVVEAQNTTTAIIVQGFTDVLEFLNKKSPAQAVPPIISPTNEPRPVGTSPPLTAGFALPTGNSVNETPVDIKSFSTPLTEISSRSDSEKEAQMIAVEEGLKAYTSQLAAMAARMGFETTSEPGKYEPGYSPNEQTNSRGMDTERYEPYSDGGAAERFINTLIEAFQLVKPTEGISPKIDIKSSSPVSLSIQGDATEFLEKLDKQARQNRNAIIKEVINGARGVPGLSGMVAALTASLSIE